MTDTEHDEQMVLTYVPEAEYLSWFEAIELALVRDDENAEQLERSVNG